MRLTDHTDYSLRVLMYLNQRKTLVTLNELSQKLVVSKNNLIKVSNQLSKLGLIHTTNGRTGGLIIHERPGQTSLKEIISKTEETFSLAECFAEKRCNCTFLKNCHLRKTLRDALNVFMESLAKTTLDDVTPSA